MPSDPRRPLAERPELNVGLDRELDLAAERPSVDASDAPRGPGLMVTAIVASSLALAGVITLVRGASEADVDEPASLEPTTPALPSLAEADVVPLEPIAPTAPPPAESEPARAEPLAASVSRTPPPPPEITPATIARPTVRHRSSAPDLEPRPIPDRGPRFQLPVPSFDDPDSAEPSEPPTPVPTPSDAAASDPTESSPPSEDPSAGESIEREPERGEPSADPMPSSPPARDPGVEPPLPGQHPAQGPPDPAVPSAPAPDPVPLPV